MKIKNETDEKSRLRNITMRLCELLGEVILGIEHNSKHLLTQVLFMPYF